jgi:hypothetical protein
VEEEENIIGTMLIQLPSVFTGGKISVFDGDDEVEDEDDFINSFNIGGPNNEAEFACHFVCHYSDCQYEIEEITSGSRILLRYSFCYNKDGVKPTALILRNSVAPLQTSLSLLHRADSDRMILVPLRHYYSPTSLALHGIDVLRPDHRAKAESIKIAGGKNWRVLILNAANTYTTSDHDENGRSKISSVIPYDDRGRKVDPTWMLKVIDFKPMGGVNKGGGGRMMLSTSNQIIDNWGNRKSKRRKALHGHGYDSDSYYGYGHTSYEYIRTFKATFLLAYDTDSVFELKCIEVANNYSSGRIVQKDGVVAAAEDVIAKQNYSLLGRLLDVVEAKEELRLGTITCRKLLSMMINSTVQMCNDTLPVSRTLGALSTLAEPDSVLWDTIILAVKKFGWHDLRAPISSLLFDKSRKKENDSYSKRTSRITLEVFLNRIDFCLKLGVIFAGEEVYADSESDFIQRCISECIGDLANTDKKSLSVYGGLVKKIDFMVEVHGWKAMASVVKHSLEFLSSNASTTTSNFVGNLVSKLHARHRCSITLDASRSFASDFASVAQKSSYYDLRACFSSSIQGDRVSLLASIRVVIEHGGQNAMDRVGKQIISHRSTFSPFLKTASEEVAIDSIDPQTFLLDALNKLFVQQSIDSESACACRRGSSCECRWSNAGTSDNAGEDSITVSPSLHIKLTLDASPNLAHMKDKDGRLPLHYAAARGIYDTVACILEANPKAAVIRDPVTGLYPFMLAGSNDNAAAAFDLLLADPNLVIGGIPVDEDDGGENGKKRKRSPSM